MAKFRLMLEFGLVLGCLVNLSIFLGYSVAFLVGWEWTPERGYTALVSLGIAILTSK